MDFYTSELCSKIIIAKIIDLVNDINSEQNKSKITLLKLKDQTFVRVKHEISPQDGIVAD